MISAINMNALYNKSVNFGKKPADKGSKNQNDTAEDTDYLKSMDLISKARAAETIAARTMSEEEELKALKEIHEAASTIINEVNSLYNKGNVVREDGSSVKIISTNNGKETMYETSSDIKTTRRSHFQNGKLNEIRILMKSQNGVPREIIIKTYNDGESLKDYEFKMGQSGEGIVDTLVTYTENGDIVAYMGKVSRMLSESAVYINL